ncbi:MAG TPA: hypothetical protein VKY45_13145 [Marinilabiliaceae bacterium]|nr:hypothetical protein [Marinilabiliaceae bacterium]
MNSIEANISRLSLHDSHLENLARIDDLTVATFDWAYLSDFIENGYETGIVLGRCKLKIRGITDEEFRVYKQEGKGYDIEPIPNDITQCWDEIANTEIDELKQEMILDGIFTCGSISNWIEWKFNYASIELEWYSFITDEEWNKGILPSSFHKILDSLPVYGEMYIPISESGEPFYSEGFIVEFNNGNNTWIANFQEGFSDLNFTYEFSDDRILVIAGGEAYLMNSNSKTPIKIFGGGYKNVIIHDSYTLILLDDVSVDFINENGIVWESPRISFDGIEDLKIENNILSGKSFDPINDADVWIDFTINLETKEVQGGSFRKYYSDSGEPIKKKPWWKII